MHVGNQMISGTTLQRNMVAIRTVIVEVKYINSKNVVIHPENCKVEIPLDITVACEQALHLGDIVKSTRARGTREETRLRGAGKRKGEGEGEGKD